MAAIHIAFMDGFRDALFRGFDNMDIRIHIDDALELAYRAGQKLGIKVRKEK